MGSTDARRVTLSVGPLPMRGSRPWPTLSFIVIINNNNGSFIIQPELYKTWQLYVYPSCMSVRLYLSEYKRPAMDCHKQAPAGSSFNFFS
jgi:hypothetical protein